MLVRVPEQQLSHLVCDQRAAGRLDATRQRHGAIGAPADSSAACQAYRMAKLQSREQRFPGGAAARRIGVAAFIHHTAGALCERFDATGREMLATKRVGSGWHPVPHVSSSCKARSTRCAGHSRWPGGSCGGDGGGPASAHVSPASCRCRSAQRDGPQGGEMAFVGYVLRHELGGWLRRRRVDPHPPTHCVPPASAALRQRS